MRGAWALAGVVALGGCASPAGGPYRTPSEESRNTVEAQRLNRLGADRLEDGDLDAAERLLAEAITEDLWYGPAHNNLGVVHLERGDLYEAAHEFEAARKLMPGHPDPRMNLGIALERAARVDEAIAAYAAALEVYSDHLPAMQALARLQVSAGKVDERTGRSRRESPPVVAAGDSLLRLLVSARKGGEWMVWAARGLLRRSSKARRPRGTRSGLPPCVESRDSVAHIIQDPVTDEGLCASIRA